MQTYKIKIINYDDPSDIGELTFSQEEINNFLDFGAPYDESQIKKESTDPTLVPIISVEVETTNKKYQWHNAYYSEETFTLMVISAIKQNSIQFIHNSNLDS